MLTLATSIVFVLGFAAGYGLRSLKSAFRHRRARLQTRISGP